MLRSVALFALVAASFGCSISTSGLFGAGGDESPASSGAGASGSSGGTGGASTRGAGGSMGKGGGSISVGVAAGGGSQGGGSQGGGGGHGGQGGHGPDCDMLLQNVNDALANAQACTHPLLGGATPCKSVEMGVCCPVVVAFGDSSETNDYLQALAIYENAGCHAQCPDKMCDQSPSGSCNAPIGGNGTCVVN
jgi:hypothetical protein